MEDPEEYKQAGNAAFAAGLYNEAIAQYTMAISLDPSNAALFSNRAAAYTKIEEYQKAKYDASMCIELKPEWPKGYWRKGTAEIEDQEFKAAIKTFERGLEYSPTDQNLVEGRKKAIQRAAIVDSVLGSEYGDFDIDAERSRPTAKEEPVVDEAGQAPPKPEESHVNGDVDNKDWPGPLEEEIARINGATNHYELLHVPRDAVAAQLKKNYHLLARMLHPDKCKLPGGEEAMKNVSIAYETLTNEGKRKQYDAYMEARKADPEGQPETFAQWEARRANTNLPPWLVKLLQIRGCLFVFALLLLVILIPLISIFIIVWLIYWLIVVMPKEAVLRCCYPDQWEDYKERKAERRRRARQRMDEEMQDEMHAHV